MSSTNFYLEEGNNYLEDEILIEQPSTQVVLHTEEKYINNDISLNLNIKSGSATTPATTITTNPTITVSSSGLITASYNGSKSITPTVSAGWISSGTAGTVSTNGSSTLSLTTQTAQTITPGTANQTIAAGKYLIGDQTIAGDSNLVAENIAEGVSIFGVTGTHSGGGADLTDFIENRNIWTSYENLSATRITTGAFYSCANLGSVNFPVCTTISSYAFDNCSKLESVNFPACTTIGVYAFNNCSHLTSVNFPSCKHIGSYAFNNCSRFTSVNFPSCTSIGSYAFNNCSNLRTASFPACRTIVSYAFCKCCNLRSIYLTGSYVVDLTNSNAFSSTPIAGYTNCTNGSYGSIYVPASMLSRYKTTTNWTYFSNRIVGK